MLYLFQMKNTFLSLQNQKNNIIQLFWRLRERALMKEAAVITYWWKKCKFAKKMQKMQIFAQKYQQTTFSKS